MVAFVCLKVLTQWRDKCKSKDQRWDKAVKKNQNWRSMDLYIGANTDFLKSISRNGNWNHPF